jgi:hypothetical protein
MKDSKIRPKVEIPVFAVCLIINIVMFVYCAVRWDSIPRYAFSLRPGTKIVFQIGLIEIPVVLLLLIFVHAIGVLFPSLGFYPGIRITESNRIPIQNCIRNMGDISLGIFTILQGVLFILKATETKLPFAVLWFTGLLLLADVVFWYVRMYKISKAG